VYPDHCMAMTHKWHLYREDLEKRLALHLPRTSITKLQTGNYVPSIFHGHCTGRGDRQFLSLGTLSEKELKLIKLVHEGKG
jgi:hypothetical protein